MPKGALVKVSLESVQFIIDRRLLLFIKDPEWASLFNFTVYVFVANLVIARAVTPESVLGLNSGLVCFNCTRN